MNSKVSPLLSGDAHFVLQHKGDGSEVVLTTATAVSPPLHLHPASGAREGGEAYHTKGARAAVAREGMLNRDESSGVQGMWRCMRE